MEDKVLRSEAIYRKYDEGQTNNAPYSLGMHVAPLVA